MTTRPASGRREPIARRWEKDRLSNPLTYLRVTRDAARDVARWRRGEPSTARTYLAMRVLHRRTAGASSRAALAALRLVPGAPDVDAKPSLLDVAWRPAATSLRTDGIAYLPPLLDADAVERLRQFASTAPGHARLADGSMVNATYATRSEDARSVRVLEQFVLANPDVQRLIASPDLLELARRHFGAGAVVHPPTLYWSCGGRNANPDIDLMLARRYHWDFDGLRGLRVHLYLTDVDEQAAPMRYVAGSHRVGAYRSAALRRGDLGVPTDDVWTTFDRADERTMVGPAGTAFVSDSSGLHSGTDPISRDRLFFVMPLQATGFAGYQLKARPVVPRDESFAAAVADGRPELRLFAAGGTS